MLKVEHILQCIAGLYFSFIWIGKYMIITDIQMTEIIYNAMEDRMELWKRREESTAGPAGAKRLQHSPDLKYGDNIMIVNVLSHLFCFMQSTACTLEILCRGPESDLPISRTQDFKCVITICYFMQSTACTSEIAALNLILQLLSIWSRTDRALFQP